MALFCATVRRDSVSFLKLLFLCHVHVFSSDILFVCRLKWLYSCFSSHFCLLVIFVLLMLALSLLFLVTVVSLQVIVSMHQGYLQCWWVCGCHQQLRFHQSHPLCKTTRDQDTCRELLTKQIVPLVFWYFKLFKMLIVNEKSHLFGKIKLKGE